MIQTGTVGYGQFIGTSGWNLSTGGGNRTFTSPDISFNPPFSNPPKVSLVLMGIDSDHNRNLRVTLEPHDVEDDEFNIKINTWSDSILYAVWVTWIAHD